MNRIITKWFYRTDYVLDEGDLDSFHDKSIVRAEAKKLARIIYGWLILSFIPGAVIF